MTAICPQCGAPLERHNFILICGFCGYYTAIDNKEVEKGEQPSRNNVKERFEYVSKQYGYIKKHCPVDIINNKQGFIILARDIFCPNDGKIIRNNIRFRYEATISETEFILKLDIDNIIQNKPIAIKTDYRMLVPEALPFNGGLSLNLFLKDLLDICESEDIDIYLPNIDENLTWDEMITVSRRFYHSIIDRSYYGYSLNKKLLIDTLKTF